MMILSGWYNNAILKSDNHVSPIKAKNQSELKIRDSIFKDLDSDWRFENSGFIFQPSRCQFCQIYFITTALSAFL